MFAAIAITVSLILGGAAVRVHVQEALAGPPVSYHDVRAIYLSSGIAASSRFEELLQLISTTNVNAFVIDLKDADGRLAFRPTTESIQRLQPDRVTIPNLPRRVDAIHARGGYAIARIAVFQDSWYAESHPAEALQYSDGRLWRDQIGYAWIDPASRNAWEYARDLAYEARQIGFDEVNVDYIRFPSDGALGRIVYPQWDGNTPKVETIRSFLAYLDANVRQRGIPMSADIFGLTFYARDGLGIGQQLEFIAPHVDVLAPMVYPSHYRSGFIGKDNPADHPYEVITATLEPGMRRLAALPEEQRPLVRPWLQDFNLGAVYDASMVQSEMRAATDAGSRGWMIWNPRGLYHSEALDGSK